MPKKKGGEKYGRDAVRVVNEAGDDELALAVGYEGSGAVGDILRRCDNSGKEEKEEEEEKARPCSH